MTTASSWWGRTGHEPVVGIDLTNANRLVEALQVAADDLDAHVAGLSRLLSTVGADLEPVRAISDVGAWCRLEHIRLSRLVDQVRVWEAAGVDLPFAIWAGTDHASFADPGRAHAGALQALDAWYAGDRARTVALLAEWTGDPVFSASVLARLGVDGLLEALCQLASLDHYWESDGGLTPELAVVIGLSEAFATAAHASVAPFDVRALVTAAGKDPFRLSAIGLLALNDAGFDGATLVELVDAYVLAVNEQIQAGELVARDLMLGGLGSSADPRALVLHTVARHPHAAAAVLRERTRAPGVTNLDLLLVERNAYGDDGVALGMVLVAGTQPADDRTATDTSAFDVITWVARQGDLPPAAHDVLGRLAQPYVGSFRPDHLGAGVTDDPLPALDETPAVAFATYAARREASADALRSAAVAWAARQFDDQASHPLGGSGYNEIGGVVGLVDAAFREGAVHRAREADAEREADRLLVNGAVSLAVTFATKTVVPPAAFAAEVVGSVTVDQFMPAAQREVGVLRDLPQTISAAQLAAEMLLLAALWRNRTRNGLFDIEGSNPGRGAPPPPALVDPFAGTPAQHLREFLSWKEHRDVNGSQAGRLLDDLGASYGEAGLAGH